MKYFAMTLGAMITMTVAVHASSPIKVDTDKGKVIAGSNSYKTLYTYDKDADGISNCYGDCAEKWPPHLAEYWDSARPPFGMIERTDSKKKQWTKEGMPLYFSTLDNKKGDTNGDGVDGMWKASRP